jgi:hypothetical protein
MLSSPYKRRILATLVVAAVASGLSLLLFLKKAEGSPSRFVLAGDMFCSAAAAPQCLTISQNSGGYDGQFYYRESIAPLSTQARAHGIAYDYPVYRQQRIGYPLLAYVVSGGDPCRALWSLILINAISIVLICVLIVASFETLSIATLVSAGLWSGFIFSLARDTTEPLAVLFLVAGCAAHARKHRVLVVCLWTAAALTRETTLIAPLVAGLLALIDGMRQRRWPFDAALFAIPLAAFIAWKASRFIAWQLPMNFSNSPLALPGSAAWAFVRSALDSHSRYGFVTVIEVLILLAITVLAAVSVRRSTAPPIVTASAVAYGAFVWSLDRGIWIEDWAIMRAASEFAVLAQITIAGSQNRWIRVNGSAITYAAWAWLTYDVYAMR